MKNNFDQPEPLEPFEPLEPLNFEVLWKIDLYLDFYIDITSGTSRTSKFSIFEKWFWLVGSSGTSRNSKFSTFWKDQPELPEPIEPLNFVVLWKIDVYIDLYIDITSEPLEPLEPQSFQFFENYFY